MISSNLFVRRRDLATNGIQDYYCAKDFGYIIRRGKGWWASNDIRTEKVGREPNGDLVEPTLGPFHSFDEAFAAYYAAMKKLGLSR